MQSNTCVKHLQAPQDRLLHIWFEPWAEGLGFPAGMGIELRASSPLPGELEFDTTNERVAVYGWQGCTLQVFAEGELVRSFDQAVPEMSSKLSTRETITMLFGAPPVPNAQEGGTVRRRSWWRFWS